VPRTPLSVAGHLREPGGVGDEIDRCHLQARRFAYGTDGARCAPARLGDAVTEHDQAVVVLAHAELAVAELVQGDVHGGDLALDDVVARDQLVSLELERPHGLPAR